MEEITEGPANPISQDVAAALDKLKELEENQTAKKDEPVEEACPCCGFKKSEFGKVPDSDKQEFLRSILGRRLYSKQYRALDDKLVVTLGAMSSRESDDFNNVLLAQTFSNEYQLIELGVRLKFLYMVKAVSLGGSVDKYEVPAIKQDKPLDVNGEFRARFGECSDAVVHIITRMVLSFDSLYKKLIRESLDKDFYEGAGPF